MVQSTLLLALIACGAPSPARPDASTGPAAPPTPSRAAVLHQLDERVPASQLSPALAAHDADLRLAAVTGLAHYHRPDALPFLHRAAADPDPRVRAAAIRGLALHPDSTPVERERHVLAALAAEPPGASRGVLLLSAAPALASAPAWLFAAPDQLAAACHALTLLAREGRPLRGAPAAAAGRLAQARDPARSACVAALAAAAEAGWRPSDEAIAALRPHLETGEPALRLAAGRALIGTTALPWADALGHPDPMLRLAAARRAAQVPASAPAAARLAAIRQHLAELAEHPARFSQPHVHALRVLLQSLRSEAADSTVAAAAAALFSALDRARPAAPARGWALAHCDAAELTDLARAWPARVRGCAEGLLPDAVEVSAEVRCLGASEDSHELRFKLLRKHLEHPSARVRREIARAAASLPPAMRGELLAKALRADFPEVAAAALQVLARVGQPTTAERQALLGAADLARAEPAVARAWLGALRSGHPPTQLIEPFATHVSPDIRRMARELLAEPDGDAPRPAAESPAALPEDRMPPGSAVFRVELKTTAGTVSLELPAADTPVAAVRVVALVRAGHYDDQPVAEAFPGQLVAFGPATRPAGGFLRHEGPAVGLRRGDVALLDHARDAVSGQLLVALEDRPELAGRVTRVGTAVTGLDVLDALTEADQVVEARVKAH